MRIRAGLAVLVILSPFATADWSQAGGDPGRTGQGDGPQLPSTARYALSENPWSGAIHVGGSWYIAERIGAGTGQVVVHRLHEWRPVPAFQCPYAQSGPSATGLHLAYGHEAFWVTHDGAGVRLGEDGSCRQLVHPVWQGVDSPGFVIPLCGHAVVAQHGFYWACQGPDVLGRYDATGDLVWLRPLVITPDPDEATDARWLFTGGVDVQSPLMLMGLAADPHRVVAVVQSQYGGLAAAIGQLGRPVGEMAAIVAFDQDGSVDWSRAPSGQATTAVASPSTFAASPPVMADGWFAYKAFQVMAGPVADPQTPILTTLPAADSLGHGLGWRAGVWYSIAPTTLHSFQVAVEAGVTMHVLQRLESPPGWTWTSHLTIAPMTSEDFLYAFARGPHGPAWCAVALQGLQWKWCAEAGPMAQPQAALAAGVLVAVEPAGSAPEDVATLLVVGQRPDGPKVAWKAGSNPMPGVVYEIDLSRSVAGSQGPLEAYRIDWGDGTKGDWQTSPQLRHVYREAATFTAVLEVRGGNETSAALVDLHVGVPDEALLNFMQQAFSDDYRDTTWGIIGLGAVLLGGVAAAWKRRQRGARLRRELDALNRIVDEWRHDGTRCEEELAARRADARMQALAGRFDEVHLFVLDRRIDELVQRLRVGHLRDAFDDLPHGLVRTIQQMLADARITGWERQRLADLLQAERSLSARRRAEVLAVVDGWMQRDGDAIA